jgi:hypothetical protein
MKRAVLTIAVFSLLGLAAPVSATAQPAVASNPNIVPKYNPPTTAKYQGVYNRLQQRKVLETLQLFLAPLNLPQELRIETAECGVEEGAPPYRQYVSGGPVTICYEYVDMVESLAPSEPAADWMPYQVGHYDAEGPIYADRETAIAGPVIQELLHNVALAAFDIYKIPVWGRMEDAADDAASLLMLQFGTDTALRTVKGAAWFLVKSNEKNAPNGSYRYSYLGAVRPPAQQRYFNLICMAVGGNFDKFSNFVAIDHKPGALELSVIQAAQCQDEYEKVASAFRTVLLDKHVNQEVLKVTRTIDWLRMP